jgi:two-component system CheB/CheR fusion protein
MPGSRPHEGRAVRPRSERRSSPESEPEPPVARVFRVVGIGASAGGLEACRKLVECLGDGGNAAFILIQHLDPTHASMMVELLAGHTTMKVVPAQDGMLVEPGRLYIITPGSYLSVAGGALRVSQPTARRGSRLPFNFLLESLASEYADRAVCVVLSGTGSDGSLGLVAIKEAGGLVLVQQPEEAGYDGMPRSAIATGKVDSVLPVAKIADVLMGRDSVAAPVPDETEPAAGAATSQDDEAGVLAKIVELLRADAGHDFTHYKPGTLKRRIERRMAMMGIDIADVDGYLKILGDGKAELGMLAKDLLINVTSFFRDPKVFDELETKIVPALVRSRSGEHMLRVWVAGCSTGEEAYSIAMLLREQIAAANVNVKLQVFASDIDAEAIAVAREGVYPETIEADVSAARLQRFFVKEEGYYRILPDLRTSVIFAVQDILVDPPFARLDFVSCRNLLIYLRPEAQERVIALFRFALREGGILMLGSSETVGAGAASFEVLSKTDRIYRRLGRNGPEEFRFGVSHAEKTSPPRRVMDSAHARPATLADLCRRLVLEYFAPVAVLINQKHECLYHFGATDSYLSVPSGHPVLDVIEMAREGVRSKLRSAIQRATVENKRILVPDGRVKVNGVATAFSIVAQPVSHEGEDFLLIAFIEDRIPESRGARSAAATNGARTDELERELEATRRELQSAFAAIETSSQEQKAINEEALSVNEEYQATNEELIASKEELQSLNEELTALNSQLQETLEKQRTTSNDLQNVLYSTDVATLFLDVDLNIRFYTPAVRLLFNVIPGDIGRPLADLSVIASDSALLEDARLVLRNLGPVEREIEGSSGAWYYRRVLPYRTQSNEVEGVVITFTDVTDRRQAADAIDLARREAQDATAAKSRFLAAASHDLRQPLQTLSLIQGILAKSPMGSKEGKLVERIDETLGAMSGMLNALLDINQIEAGTVRSDPIDFPIGDLIERLRGEFIYHAQAKGLTLRTVACGLTIRSDPRLLEQMIRNLLSNALKYTRHGKVLLGCRRRKDTLSIEIWDTGIGIPTDEFQAIFEEYHQLDNAARERSRGLGLGLSIVQRLGALLGHRVRVRSVQRKGSVFAIDVALPAWRATRRMAARPASADDSTTRQVHRTGKILLVDDDPDVLELLELALKDEGHMVATALDGPKAMQMIAHAALRPDLVLADYNLPNGMNGLELGEKLRAALKSPIPIVVLTGDISTDTLRSIASQNYLQLNKPVKIGELLRAIQRLLPAAAAAHREATLEAGSPTVYVVDDDSNVRVSLRAVLEDDGLIVEDYDSCEAFLKAYRPGGEGCLLIDSALPGMSGLQLLQKLGCDGISLSSIMITGHGDVGMAVRAMKAGASDFIEKPVGSVELLASIARALDESRDVGKREAGRAAAATQIADLTARQRQIMDLVLAGQPSKNIAADLGISQRTVENHRASIMKKTGAKSLPALARLALAAATSAVKDEISKDNANDATLPQ